MNDTALRLFLELKKHSFGLIIVMVSIAAISLAMLSFGHILKLMIDHGIAANNMDSLNSAILQMVVAVLVLGMASFIRAYYINSISSNIVSDIRIKTYKALLDRPIEYFESVKVSDIISRFSHDLSLIGDIITNILSFSIRNIFMIIGGIVMMFLQNPKLSLIVIISLPVTLVLIKFVGKKVRIMAKELHAQKANIEEIIGETLSNIRVVYSFNVEEYRIAKLIEKSKESDELTSGYLKVRALFFALSIFVITSLLLLVLRIGGIDVLEGIISSGSMVSFIFYSATTAFAIGGVAEVMGDLQKSFAGADRVFELSEKQLSHISPVTSKFHGPLRLSFSAKNFSYPSRPDTEVIKNIEFEAGAGQFIGIAGPSGSGKSTILQILMGIYRPKTFRIKINDKEVDLTSNKELRSKIAYIPQDPFLFSTTIKENITLGRDLGSLDYVIKLTGLKAVLDSIPNGIETYVGEKGTQLSGGQKQRIALARGLYGNPEILLLDEATSALDMESEHELLQHIRTLMKNKIIISVAHRISAIKDADKIMLIHNGALIAEGSHEQLLKKVPLYTHNDWKC